MFLDVFQCCCDIKNLPIWNLVKLRSLACGDISRENSPCSIQDGVVIIYHGGEAWIEQGGGKRRGGSMKQYCKRDCRISQWLSMEGKMIRCGEGVGRGAFGGISMMITNLIGLRSVPKVLCICPLNDSLVSFVIRMLTNKFYTLMLSHPCFRCLRSLHFLPWSITSL